MSAKRAAWMCLLSSVLLLAPAGSASCRDTAGPPSPGVPPAGGAGRGTGAAPAGKQVFPSPLAGTWYEADPGRLAAEIDRALGSVEAVPLSPVCALLLPHAGLRWSLATAARAVKEVQGQRFRRVILLGPSHYVPLRNAASVPDATDYATPLGEVPLDTEVIRGLLSSPLFHVVPPANQREHSVQVMLPVLQRALGPFRFVPVVLGSLDLSAVRALAGALRPHLGPETLLVVSSDFTHYGPDYGYVPFSQDVPASLKRLDLGAFRFIEDRDLPGFADYVERTGATICGQAAIEVMLALLPPEARVHLLHYATSGAMTGDFANSVSYVSAAVTCTWKGGGEAKEGPPQGAALSAGDRARLLALARGTLAAYLETGRMPTPEQLGVQVTEGMKQVMGAFVTIKEDGQLRGCIGEIFPVRPLAEVVMDHAVDAGVRDPRFPPVKAPELPRLAFEISALTPPHPVTSYRDIVLGRDGIVLEKSGRSAVFLPQVAPEQGWTLEETLTHLARKAGLPGDAWKQGASFTVFQAIVFHEGEP